MTLRIFKDRLYHFKGGRYIYVNQGTGKATIAYENVVMGAFVGTRGDRSDCTGEWRPDGRTYRVEDGHLPDRQPRVSAADLAAFMAAGPYPVAVPVSP